jgi:hypothetical protein
MQICLNHPLAPIFCASNIEMTPLQDPSLDPIEKHITPKVSISLYVLQTLISLRNQTLSSTFFSENDPFQKKCPLICRRVGEISLLAGAATVVTFIHTIELVVRIALLALSRIFLLALIFDWVKGDPWFTNPLAQIPPKVGYTVLANAPGLLSGLYAAKEMVFSHRFISLSQVIDTASVGLTPKAINWSYNRH